MFPFRTSSIFRSRWMALLWAGGIVWTAIGVAGGAPKGGNEAATDASGAQVSDEDMKQAAKLLENMGR